MRVEVLTFTGERRGREPKILYRVTIELREIHGRKFYIGKNGKRPRSFEGVSYWRVKNKIIYRVQKEEVSLVVTKSFIYDLSWVPR